MRLEGKRIAILAENMYQEMELWVPYYRFKEEGADVKVVGAGGAQSYTSKHGYPVTVDVQADQVRAVEFDAIVVPGGYAPDLMRRHAPMAYGRSSPCRAGTSFPSTTGRCTRIPRCRSWTSGTSRLRSSPRRRPPG